HAGLWNVIEHIFGVMKRQWRILLLAPEYHMDVQARIPVALCAIHNFIQWLDPKRLEQMNAVDGDEDETDLGFLADGPVGAAERRRAEERRDHIAEIMWQDYCHESRQRGYM
ncbi:hypothetical protein OG21DRAFT_1427876, partial [Imleria badia]